ncbi:ribosomal protein L1p/L10e family [Wolffia australiana]
MAPSLRIILANVRRHSIKHPPFFSSPHILSSSLRHESAAKNGHFFSSSAPVKPVSYAVKPKDKEDAPSQAQEPSSKSSPQGESNLEESPSRAEKGARSLSREDARYVKDVPVISPVSYAPKVAPLPEDKASSSMAEGGAGAERESRGAGDEQLLRESRRIEASARVRRAMLIQQEEDNVPFPTLIRPEKKQSKVALELHDAIREVKANAKRNFLETVEAHVGLGVDPRRGDQMVRGAVTLPHGTGKVVRVAVFAEGPAADEARAAGADIVGGDELIEEIMRGGGKINFDKCIAIPSFMPRLGKIARILGPRGLMPNPKLGSLTSDVSGAVKAAKCGRVDFKIDKTAIVHVGLGKVNFSEEALRENIAAFVNALLLAKPTGLKKTSKYAGYLNTFALCSTMGPGFPVSIQSISAAADNYTKLQGK